MQPEVVLGDRSELVWAVWWLGLWHLWTMAWQNVKYTLFTTTNPQVHTISTNTPKAQLLWFSFIEILDYHSCTVDYCGFCDMSYNLVYYNTYVETLETSQNGATDH